MSRKSRLKSSALGVVAFLTLALACQAMAASNRVLTADGELATLAVGEHELVLRVGDAEFAVPGTTNGQNAPMSLIRSGQGLAAVWSSASAGTSSVRIATFDGTEWSEIGVLEAGNEPIEFSVLPQVFVQDDRVRIELEQGDALDVDRQVVHFVWSADGSVRHSSFVLRDGTHQGWNQVLTVSSAYWQAHYGAGDGSAPASVGAEASLLGVRESADGSLLVSLHDAASESLGTIRISTTPLLMEVFGDAIFDQVLNNADLFDPEDTSSLADQMGGSIVYIGARLQLDADLSHFMSSQIAEWLEQSGSEFGWDLMALADASRSQALDLGRSVYSVTSSSPSGEGEVAVLDISDFLDDNGHQDEFARLTRVQIASDLPMPEDVGADSTLHLSADGTTAAIAWTDGDRIVWLEGHEGTWSEAKSLAINEEMDESSIRQLIAESIR